MTDASGLAATARQVIDTSRYLVLATADQHGVPWTWTVNQVQAPADHRLHRAVAVEQSVLEPGGVDVCIPVNTESIAAR